MTGNDALRRGRTARKLTQAELAEKVGVTSLTVSRWETGRRMIRRDLVPIISECLGVPGRQLRPDLAEWIGANE